MTDEEYSQIVYTLWQAGLENSRRAESLQQQLSVAANALKNTSYKLPDELARSIENKLPDAAEKAAAMIASRWTEANTHAERATAAYKDATDHARRNIYGAAAALIAVFAFALILMGLWIFPSFDELASMREEKARLHATITQLKDGGGLANVQSCQDSTRRTRLCVRVDETAKVSDKRWRVIRGY